MTRDRPAQGRPTPGGSYRGFPARRLAAGRRLWRVARHSPWWFCTDGQCRFDLALPQGTCYLATDELTGMLEVLGPGLQRPVVPASFFAERRIYGIDLPSAVRLANTASRGAAGFGVTNELTSMTPYTVPQAWAVVFADAGFGGIAYRARFDPGPHARAVALFGPAGEADWDLAAHRAIDHELLALLERHCGVRVAPIPRLTQLVRSEPRP